MESRLIAVEEKIAHLERYLGELDGVVRELHDRMDGYKSQIDRLRDEFGEHLSNADDAPEPGRDDQLEDDKPPHW
ncbi:MAG: SlyX family protein [Planctomycetota bacterium]